MFEIGQYVTYDAMGVCCVQDIVMKKISRTEPEQQYYVLQPLYQSGTITVSVRTKSLRPVLTREEALALIDNIPSITAEAYHNRNLQQLENHYRTQLQSNTCEDLLRLAISTYKKKQEREAARQKFGAVDRRYMERAEDYLYGELAVSLGIGRETVPAFIHDRLQDTVPEFVAVSEGYTL